MIITFPEAQDFLFSHIPHGTKQQFPAEKGLARAKYLLELLGNPQEKIRIVHIAGTSGKGSVAYLTSQLLTALGKKTGLHVSPHILDIRERVQINNQLISEEKFVRYLNQILPAVEKVSASSYGKPTYFEILTTLAFIAFAGENVDYAVIETGMGGLYDGTNVVENKNKVCIITKIGLDHTQVLGNTIGKIAQQKAGIIHPGNVVISASQRKTAESVLAAAAAEKKADIFFLSLSNYQDISVSLRGTVFDFSFQDIQLPHISLSLIGKYQAENASLALAAVNIVSRRDQFVFSEETVKEALTQVSLPARFDVQSIHRKAVILDGAHNPQKMRSFLATLHSVVEEKPVFVISFKQGKDSVSMTGRIAQEAAKIIVTSFGQLSQDMSHVAQSPREIASSIKKTGYHDVEIIDSVEGAVKKALSGREKTVVFTGSLYFCSEVYKVLQNDYSSQHGSL